MRLLPLILVSCMVLGAAEKKATKKKKPAPAPAPPPVVESVKTDLYAEIMEKGVLSKFMVEEQLLLEKCKASSPKLYRDALVEIHQKRLDAVKQRHLWLISMAGKIPDKQVEDWKADLESCSAAIPVLKDAIKRLEDLPL